MAVEQTEVTIPVIGGYLAYINFIIICLLLFGKMKAVKAASGFKERILPIFEIIGFAVLIVFLIQYYNYFKFGIANDALLFISLICLMVPVFSYFTPSKF